VAAASAGYGTAVRGSIVEARLSPPCPHGEPVEPRGRAQRTRPMVRQAHHEAGFLAASGEPAPVPRAGDTARTTPLVTPRIGNTHEPRKPSFPGLPASWRGSRAFVGVLPAVHIQLDSFLRIPRPVCLSDSGVRCVGQRRVHALQVPGYRASQYAGAGYAVPAASGVLSAEGNGWGRAVSGTIGDSRDARRRP
jgi:hypothetical protein